MACRQMNIEILPPDINEGESAFSVSEGKIRYGLSAIKSVGKNVIDAIVTERKNNGNFISLKDFCERLTGKEVNKRTIENFIKAGAFDSLKATRRQLMMVYAQVLDQVNSQRKKSMSGQMTLFDFVSEEEKQSFDVKYPDVGEYEKEALLAYEKEVLGVYISGHPLDEFTNDLQRNVTALTTDFYIDEEKGRAKLEDGANVVIGGMIMAKTVKATRNNKMMAFITLEDLVGTVEVIIFPDNYERHKEILTEDTKVYIKGRVSAGDDQQAKLICEKITPFAQVPKEVWIKYPSKDVYLESEPKLYQLLENEDGNDKVVIFCEKEKVIKKLPRVYNIHVNDKIISQMSLEFGADNIKIIQKP